MDFTPAGLWQIFTALPELRDKEAAFRQAMGDAGYTYDLPDYAGVRTDAQTAQLIAWRDQAVADGEPTYRVAPAATSYHNRGAAFDIQITTPTGATSDDYQAAAEIGQGVGLNPGFYFPAPNDPFHFELPYDLATVSRMWSDYTTKVVAVTGGVSAGVLALIAGGLYLLGRRAG